MTIAQIKKYLLKVYSKDTCYPRCRDNWSIKNPTLGHCAIVSLILNDYFGGEIYKIKVDGMSHYFNYIDNKIIDLTKDQFNCRVDYTNKQKKSREEMLDNTDTLFRYKLLCDKLKLLLESENIYSEVKL